MPGITFEQLVSFISNNFELLILINFSICGFFLILILTLKYAEYVAPHPVYFFQRTLFLLVTIGQLFMLVMSGYIYWLNYKKENVIDYDAMMVVAIRFDDKLDVKINFINRSFEGHGTNNNAIKYSKLLKNLILYMFY